MRCPPASNRWKFALGIALLGLTLSGCTYSGFGSPEGHFATFSVPEPKGAAVHVCHGYGCRIRTRFRFTDSDLKEVRELMTKWRSTESAEDERRAIAYAVGWMETRVGKVIGTDADRAGMDFAGSGDPTQQDCVDEATNTTSYLTVLANAGLLQHHTVGTPFAKENYLRGIEGWTHWTAVLEEKSNKQRWAVDSWIYANGENPAVVKAEEWYISSLNDLPEKKM